MKQTQNFKDSIREFVDTYRIRIDPQTGKITGALDCSTLLQPRPTNSEAVPNGIAYDAKKKSFYLTGKNWDKLFEVEFVSAGKR